MRVAGLSVFLSLFALLPAQAQPLPRTGTFLYSTQCWEKESGDATGSSVKLVRTLASDTLEFGWGEGPTMAAMATELRITPHGTSSTISFTIHPDSPQDAEQRVWHFTGTISTTEITLNLTNSATPGGRLPRRALTYKPGECR